MEIVVETLEKAAKEEPKSLDNRRQIDTCAYRGEVIFEGEKVTRGLCVACYSLLRKRVDAGETSWEELESQGNAVPPKKSGRRPIKLLAQQLNTTRSTSRKNQEK